MLDLVPLKKPDVFVPETPSRMMARFGSCWSFARAIVLGLEEMREGPGANIQTCVQPILVGRAEMNPSIKPAHSGLFRR